MERYMSLDVNDIISMSKCDSGLAMKMILTQTVNI